MRPRGDGKSPVVVGDGHALAGTWLPLAFVPAHTLSGNAPPPACRPQVRQVRSPEPSPEPSLDDAPIDRDNRHYESAAPIGWTAEILANGLFVKADGTSEREDAVLRLCCNRALSLNSLKG